MFTMPIQHCVEVQVAYVDAGGNPARIDGAVSWSSSDESVATVEASADDSTICVVTSLLEVGKVQVVATADADLGDGVRALVTTMSVEVIPGEAVAGTISPVGDPVPAA